MAIMFPKFNAKSSPCWAVILILALFKDCCCQSSATVILDPTRKPATNVDDDYNGFVFRLGRKPTFSMSNEKELMDNSIVMAATKDGFLEAPLSPPYSHATPFSSLKASPPSIVGTNGAGNGGGNNRPFTLSGLINLDVHGGQSSGEDQQQQNPSIFASAPTGAPDNEDDMHEAILSWLHAAGIGSHVPPTAAMMEILAASLQAQEQDAGNLALQQDNTDPSKSFTSSLSPQSIPDSDDDEEDAEKYGTAWPTPESFAKPEYPFDPQRYPNPPILLDLPPTTTLPPTPLPTTERTTTAAPVPTSGSTTMRATPPAVLTTGSSTPPMSTTVTTTTPMRTMSPTTGSTTSTTFGGIPQTSMGTTLLPAATSGATTPPTSSTTTITTPAMTTPQMSTITTPASASTTVTTMPMTSQSTSTTMASTSSRQTTTTRPISTPGSASQVTTTNMPINPTTPVPMSISAVNHTIIANQTAPRPETINQTTSAMLPTPTGKLTTPAPMNAESSPPQHPSPALQTSGQQHYQGDGCGDVLSHLFVDEDDGITIHPDLIPLIRQKRVPRNYYVPTFDSFSASFTPDEETDDGNRRRSFKVGLHGRGSLDSLQRKRPVSGEREDVSRRRGEDSEKRGGVPDKDRLSAEEYRQQVEMYRRNKLLQILSPPVQPPIEAQVGEQFAADDGDSESGPERFSTRFHRLEIPASNLQKITLTVTPTASTFPTSPSSSSSTAERDVSNNDNRRNPLEWETIIHSPSFASNNNNDRIIGTKQGNEEQQQRDRKELSRLAAFADNFRRQQEQQQNEATFDRKFGESPSANNNGNLKHRLEHHFRVTSSIHDAEGSAMSGNHVRRQHSTTPLPENSFGSNNDGRQRPAWFTSGTQSSSGGHQDTHRFSSSNHGAHLGVGEALPTDVGDATLDSIRHLLMEDLQQIMNAAGNLSNAHNLEMLSKIGLHIKGYKSDDASSSTSESWGDIDGRSVLNSGTNSVHATSDFNTVYRPVRPPSGVSSLPTTTLTANQQPSSSSSSSNRPRPQVITIGLTPVRPANRPTSTSGTPGNTLVSHFDTKPGRPSRPTISLRPVTVASNGIGISPAAPGSSSSFAGGSNFGAGSTTFRPSADVVPGATPSNPWIVPTGGGGTTLALPSDFDGEKRLNKLDFFFNSLNVNNEECRLRVLCELAKNELAMTPLSSVFLDEIRYYKGLSAVARGLEITPQGKRLLAYMEAAYKGRERQFQCNHREYPNCPRAMEDLINMDAVLVWKEVSKWLTIKVASKKEGTSRNSRYQEVDVGSG